MIKAFLINRDIWTWPKAMVSWMNQIPELEPIIIDNASTYQPTLDWYDTNPCRIIRLDYNGGHKVLWTSGLFQKEVKEDYYIVTDPDFDMSTCPLDVVDKLKEGLIKYNQPKCGLAIKIDDMPDEYPLKDQVLRWETGFWSKPLENDFYEAPIDTTFALHDSRKCRTHMIGGIRTGGDYTIRHLPFYLTPDNIDEEIAYYFEHCDKKVSSQARYLNDWVQEVYKENK